MSTGFDILIFPGQSNTVGRGIGTFVNGDPSNDSKIFQVARTPNADMTIIPAARPINYWNFETDAVHGYELSLCRAYADNILAPGRKVLIVPAAETGTSILEWLGVIQRTHDSQFLYSDMIARVNVGLGVSGSVIIGWFEAQGETDLQYAQDPTIIYNSQMPDAATYLTRKLQFIDQVRADLGTFPMLFGLFAPGWQYGDLTKAAFLAAIQTAAASRTQCGYVDSLDCQDNSSVDPLNNLIHFSTPGQEEMARRYYREYCLMKGFPVLDGFTNDGLRGSNQ